MRADMLRLDDRSTAGDLTNLRYQVVSISTPVSCGRNEQDVSVVVGTATADRPRWVATRLARWLQDSPPESRGGYSGRQCERSLTLSACDLEMLLFVFEIGPMFG